MCGRYALVENLEEVAAAFGAEVERGLEFKANPNIAPSQAVPVVVAAADGKRWVRLMRWGLVPSWAKDLSTSYKMFNARSETIGVKPAFKEAFRRRRALIPASGFYEWKKEGAKKNPQWIWGVGKRFLVFAGIWESWRPPGAAAGEAQFSTSVLTKEANALIKPIHDRMPVILSDEQIECWLDEKAEPAKLQVLLKESGAAECPLSIEPIRFVPRALSSTPARPFPKWQSPHRRSQHKRC